MKVRCMPPSGQSRRFDKYRDASALPSTAAELVRRTEPTRCATQRPDPMELRNHPGVNPTTDPDDGKQRESFGRDTTAEARD